MQVATPRLLIVDDDPALRDSLSSFFVSNNIDVFAANDARSARSALVDAHFDLVLLDVMIPGESGLSLCGHIRERFGLPVVFLSGRAEEADRILGLELGADDYIAKPCNPRELLARVRTVMRRASAAPPRPPQPSEPRDVAFFGDWILDFRARELVSEGGRQIALSTGEYALLCAFIERPRRLLSRDKLIELTRGHWLGEALDRSVDNQVSRLRKKIERDAQAPEIIKTVRGAGYILDVEVRRA